MQNYFSKLYSLIGSATWLSGGVSDEETSSFSVGMISASGLKRLSALCQLPAKVRSAF